MLLNLKSFFLDQEQGTEREKEEILPPNLSFVACAR